MDTTIANLDTWTTEELLGEVLRRGAGDRTALDRVQVTTMRAILDDCDEKGAPRPLAPSAVGAD